ncbi:hypothetical protein AVEN_12948-1 [Araneus ventricosus]|uniref:Uncharacterized protein n=1 Tax=Araneus ventricosus TaxID=182803 RepID=A0A4Y2IME0_ARAVE|nr:hypothetical protein AVEN_12948-1 [Araneus ventricosus]
MKSFCSSKVGHSWSFHAIPFLAHSFRQVIHDLSTPRKFIHCQPLRYPTLALSNFHCKPCPKSPPSPQIVPTPAAFMAQQSKWIDGYWDKLDIQPILIGFSHLRSALEWDGQL